MEKEKQMIQVKKCITLWNKIESKASPLELEVKVVSAGEQDRGDFVIQHRGQPIKYFYALPDIYIWLEGAEYATGVNAVKAVK